MADVVGLAYIAVFFFLWIIYFVHVQRVATVSVFLTVGS